MFYYRTSFSKKAVFLEKTAKNPFVGGYGSFEGRGAPGDKNQYNLFCRHSRLFPKTIGFTHEWTRTNHVNFMKIGPKLGPVS